MAESPRALVTGGLGFIGSAIARDLATRGWSVDVIDDRSGVHAASVYDRRTAALQESGVNVLVADAAGADLHPRTALLVQAAGVTSIARAAADPERANAVNVVGLEKLLNRLDAVPALRHVVQLSSSSVLGAAAGVPPGSARRTGKPAPLSDYGRSKSAAEDVVRRWHARSGIPASLIRLFNVYGVDGRPDMLPMRLVTAARDGVPLEVRGWPEAARDWTTVGDVVRVIAALVGMPAAGIRLLDVGRGRPVRIADVISTWQGIAGVTLSVRHEALWPVEPVRTWADVGPLSRLVTPPTTDIATGLRALWAWAQTTQTAPEAVHAAG